MIIATLVPALVAALEQLRDDREALLRQATALGDLPAGEAR